MVSRSHGTRDSKEEEKKKKEEQQQSKRDITITMSIKTLLDSSSRKGKQSKFIKSVLELCTSQLQDTFL